MSTNEAKIDAFTPRWVHAWAVVTVCATFVLLLLGSLVTTKRAGMADPIWPTYPWHLWLVGFTEPRPGFIIEHSHRLAGYIVGTCTIVLAVGLLFVEPRRWVRLLGVAALLGVIAQGLLGGFRVLLDQWLGTDLAVIHGCFAQIVFAMLVVLALAAGQSFRNPVGSSSKTLRRLAIAVVALVYMQIIFGALVRHTYSMSAVRHHLGSAFVVTIGVVWLVRETWGNEDRLVRRAGYLLAAFTACQLIMGVETFMGRYFMVRGLGHQIGIRTVHVLLGFLIFASAVGLAVLVWRAAPADEESSDTGDRETELAYAASVAEGEA
ncbi:MAG: heme A synthase [Gemmataceae bacterium]